MQIAEQQNLIPFPGNGCVNDFSRTLAQTVWEPIIPKDAITIFSGGTEGVLSPHVTFIVRSLTNAYTGLVATVGHTEDLAPHEIGTETHAKLVSSKVKDMMRDLKVMPADVQLVLVKCPLLTSAKLAAVRAAGREPVTSDTYESMALSRYASALGVASALGELPASGIVPALQSKAAWSAKASCSSGAELEDNHIFILASDSQADKSGPALHAISRPMSDAIDAEMVLELLSQVKRDGGKVLQVFAKAEADRKGLIRGSRHTMNTDSDIHSTRHARAAVGGLLAGLTGDPQIYVSGGAEGQGVPGGGSLCIVYETF
jgi:cyanuric acid amidohydrolase